MPTRSQQICFAAWPTDLGPVAAAASSRGLRRFILPHPGGRDPRHAILGLWPDAVEDAAPLESAIELTRRYFAGQAVEFGPLRCDLTDLSAFAGEVLRACRRVGFGSRVTYGELAARIGRPRAARAVAGALGRNPLPLIVPCHRVVGGGGLGGFSAPGGVALKQRMLDLEARPGGGPS